MATPSAAEHRDLEARFRKIERKLSDVQAVVSRRPGFTVAELTSTHGTYVTAEPDGDVTLIPAPGRAVVIGHATTANAANAHLDTDGRVYRSTSSRRYKTDIQPASVDTAAVLALQPREFRTTADVESLGDDAPTHAGFIAEEAADLGLDHWITRDADGEPESFAYSTWAVALHAVVQQQQAQLEAQREAITALEARLPAGEAGT